MESKRSQTIVSTTITTEPSCAEDPSNVDALQGRISDLTQQILLYTARQTKSFSGYVARTNMSRRRSSRCRSLVHSPNTVGGVYLGLARAGDVVQLDERMQKELDDGLYTIEARFFPRTGRPESEDYFARYHDPRWGRYRRAAGARYGYMNRMSESRLNAFYYEILLQSVLLRGIDLEELPYSV